GRGERWGQVPARVLPAPAGDAAVFHLVQRLPRQWRGRKAAQPERISLVQRVQVAVLLVALDQRLPQRLQHALRRWVLGMILALVAVARRPLARTAVEQVLAVVGRAVDVLPFGVHRAVEALRLLGQLAEL